MPKEVIINIFFNIFISFNFKQIDKCYIYCKLLMKREIN